MPKAENRQPAAKNAVVKAETVPAISNIPRKRDETLSKAIPAL
jgi:hypothetical protein